MLTKAELKDIALRNANNDATIQDAEIVSRRKIDDDVSIDDTTVHETTAPFINQRLFREFQGYELDEMTHGRIHVKVKKP